MILATVLINFITFNPVASKGIRDLSGCLQGNSHFSQSLQDPAPNPITKGAYEGVMNNFLLPSLKDWNLDYDIKMIKDLGNWHANTHYKAQFIREMLLKHKQPLVFTDADSTIEQDPVLFSKLEIYSPHIDIGVHFLNWHFFWHKRKG
ncbi:unnamed protein product, partial [marine sediment metagenome]